ncbi:MAG: hypothetical protein LC650_00680 [Actinobacteria bacterium]|nr:hypothetical protein [Actinomycetota bacterium]
MARNSNGMYDKLVTLRVIAEGDPKLWDWDTLLALDKGESVQIVNVEDA